MKVRWNRNSLRLRITPSELTALERGEPVLEELRFPGSITAGWSVGIQPGGPDTSLSQSGCLVLLRLGETDRQQLNAPEAEGVYFEMDLSEAATSGGRYMFRYLIEKDFPCIHPRAADAREEPSETFAAPPHFSEKK